MDDSIDYSIILPCFMESDNLSVLLPQIKAVMAHLSVSFEIIVVDTNKKMDSTSSVCKAHQIKYVHRSPNNSYGDAFRTGIHSGNGRWFIFMDSDGSHPPSFIPQLIDASNKSDHRLIIASRYITGGKSANSKNLVWMSKLLNAVYSYVLNINCRDVSNSFRLYPAHLLKDLVLTCEHFDILEEVLFKLVRHNQDLKIIEIPFSFKKRIHGESKRSFLIFLFNYLKTLTKLAYMRWTNK